MNFKRFRLASMLALAFAINSPSMFASDKTDVVDAVNRYLNNLDTDKIQTAVAMCDTGSFDPRRISTARMAWPNSVRRLVEDLQRLQ